MSYLSDEHSWRLFCVTAFPDGVGNRILKDMGEEGRKIVKQCGNLPLAIKTIAASLANTRHPNKWELKHRHLERVVAPIGDLDPVMEILKLSYDSRRIRPSRRRPVGYGVGLVTSTCSAVSAQLQVYADFDSGYSGAYKFNKFCKIHDLLHDLAIHIAEENKCAFSVEEISTHTSGARGWSRILLAKKGVHVIKTISESHPVYLRTLSLSHNKMITSIPTNLFTTMRGLRVLDLSSTDISTLPASVGKMILLKVLNLTGIDIRELPECVRHLKSLLFLALPIYCSQLPEWISELQCLQCLEGRGIDRMPKGISKLISLRALRSYLTFSKEEDGSIQLGDLANTTQLQELWLEISHEMQMKRMEECTLAQLVKMRCLEMYSYIDEKTELLQLPKNITAMKHLEDLTLCRFVVPSWICDLANLKQLCLEYCECSDYPELQRMPNLVSLQLCGNQSCRELPNGFGESGGFPQLRLFWISSFTLLEEFPELEEGTMPCLENFYLFNCPKLKLKRFERLKRLKGFNSNSTWTNVPLVPDI
ncbi:putative disease resistance protein RGA3 [Cryptomeria japonica]|uniref:putative disease resistance protein RGA3 n=1 Tax=Cryptomeria japonica TaxID=3369 RepID=UPI0027DA0350|nr:putative disease resistance protein RGA3 [Cryptomeria japonica]